MPAKPSWYRKIPSILDSLRQDSRSHFDRAAIEFLLGVSRRRAQQIMAPCVVERVGRSGLAGRDTLIAHLQRLVEGEEAVYEIGRRRKVARVIECLRQERIENPQLLVEAPVSVMNQELTNLPSGVRLEPGRISVEFESPQQGLEKLLALAMAIRNDFGAFESRVCSSS